MSFGLDDIVPELEDPRKVPLMPVNVRIIVPEPSSSNYSSHAEAAARDFEKARELWLEQAFIDLRLRRGSPEILPDSTFNTPAYWSFPLDHLWQRGQSWITVIYIDGTEYSSSKGYTFFAQPWEGRMGYGLVLRKDSGWITLAHEIGHALGLCHVDDDANKYEYNGKRYTEYCMEPFGDDFISLTNSERLTNLMHPRISGDAGWLSPSQVHRARLTIASRKCPYGYVFEGLFPPSGWEGSCVMDDVTAAFAVETFPVDTRYMGAEQDQPFDGELDFNDDLIPGR
ncbi:MAG: hypothetical protein ACOZNI_09840 [Myxococcota bacterium]